MPRSSNLIEPRRWARTRNWGQSGRPGSRLDPEPTRARLANLRCDDGSASLEFITAGLILLLPMVYLILAMSQIQGGAFAVEGAARQAARVFMQAETPDAAVAAAQRAIDFALADAGLPGGSAEVDIACSPVPDTCLTRSGEVTIVVRVTVALPLVPPALDVAAPVGVPLEASATQKVSRFWGALP